MEATRQKLRIKKKKKHDPPLKPKHDKNSWAAFFVFLWCKLLSTWSPVGLGCCCVCSFFPLSPPFHLNSISFLSLIFISIFVALFIRLIQTPLLSSSPSLSHPLCSSSHLCGFHANTKLFLDALVSLCLCFLSHRVFLTETEEHLDMWRNWSRWSGRTDRRLSFAPFLFLFPKMESNSSP